LTGPRKPEPLGEREVSIDPVLRAKYLDYCSARVADLLLQLTPDEMFLLAQEAADELDADAREPLSYTRIVRLATDRISRKLDLPDLPTWIDAYRKDPQRYEREMLGLWETDLRTSNRGTD
jgi:hypothetical protein